MVMPASGPTPPAEPPMSALTYQLLAARTSSGRGLPPYQGGPLTHPDIARSARRLNLACMGLCGEAGELYDLAKKVHGHGHPLDRDRLAAEAGDFLWYLAEFLTAFGGTLPDRSFAATQESMLVALAVFCGFSVADLDACAAEPLGDKMDLAAVCKLQQLSSLLTLSVDAHAYVLSTFCLHTPYDLSKLLEMANQLLMTLCGVCRLLGLDLADAAAKNLAKLKARYPDGFSPDKSIHRTE